ncbi:hypothetical protein B7760_03584 [Burkholderia glumae]|nr:hypothetical protein B7760_03584 [Burkholderia glumae]
MLMAEFLDRQAGLRLAQETNDLLFGESFLQPNLLTT